jgi:hypothetical protein
MDDNNTTTSPDAADCTHPSLPPFQSLTTEPSPPSIDNEEVEIPGVVSPADALLTPAAIKASTHILFAPAADASTPASHQETDVTNVFAFFNPLASMKTRCNTLQECFNITPHGLEGIIVACKTCTKFGIRKWKASNATFTRGHTLQCHGVAIEVCTRLLQNSQAGK